MQPQSDRPKITLPMLDDDPPLDRRGFLTRSAALAVAAALAGSCGLPTPTSPQLNGDVTIDLADYPELEQVDGVVRLRGTSVPIALVNAGGGTYLALSVVCPHQGGEIFWQGTEFVCSQHGAEFAEDGHWIGGQPTSSMYQYRASYDAVAGTVTISP